eukprot:5137860-Lingulodinium_polyedra.AAC.1
MSCCGHHCPLSAWSRPAQSPARVVGALTCRTVVLARPLGGMDLENGRTGTAPRWAARPFGPPAPT